MTRTIAWIPCGDRNNPGSRLRVFDVADALEKRHTVTSVLPPFQLTERPDCVVLQKACDRNALAFLEQVKSAGSRCLYDLCDPIWLQQDINRQRGWDVDKAIGLADEVITPTVTMSSEIKLRYPHAKCRCIPDAVDMNAPQFRLAKGHAENTLLRIGWIGTALNMEHLHMVAGALRELNRSRPLVFRLITAAHQGMIPALPDIPVEFVPWTIDGYAGRVAECDVMVIPMPLNDWTRGKSANRLQLCLALGVPAVVSPLPSFLELLDGHGELAYVARSGDEWMERLSTLLHPNLRNRVGAVGRAFIRAEHSMERRIESWEAVLAGEAPPVESAESRAWHRAC
jgi:glycosyltransferase involved in cell wall biosynthesis